MNNSINKFEEILRSKGYDYDRWETVEPIIRFAIMVANGVAPLVDAPETLGSTSDTMAHISHDFKHGWPLELGTSLRESEYREVQRALGVAKRARTCVCGNIIAYGNGVGAKHTDGTTGVCCSESCLPKHTGVAPLAPAVPTS